VVLTNHCTRNLLENVYGIGLLNYVTLIFTIPNMFAWFLYKEQNENLRKTKHEYHVLTLHENLCDIFVPNIAQFL